MPEIDTRFLKIHPATAAWFERRKKCESCANRTPHEGGIACMATFTWCIDASADDGKCGPEAKLFKPAE